MIITHEVLVPHSPGCTRSIDDCDDAEKTESRECDVYTGPCIVVQSEQEKAADEIGIQV